MKENFDKISCQENIRLKLIGVLRQSGLFSTESPLNHSYFDTKLWQCSRTPKLFLFWDGCNFYVIEFRTSKLFSFEGGRVITPLHTHTLLLDVSGSVLILDIVNMRLDRTGCWPTASILWFECLVTWPSLVFSSCWMLKQFRSAGRTINLYV